MSFLAVAAALTASATADVTCDRGTYGMTCDGQTNVKIFLPSEGKTVATCPTSCAAEFAAAGSTTGICWGFQHASGFCFCRSSSLLQATSTAVTGGTCAVAQGCQSASMGGDQHVIGADGDKFSFRGTHRGIYNLLSAPNVSLNAEFGNQIFNTPWSRMRVNGSFTKRAFWAVRTNAGNILEVAFDAGTAQAVVSGLFKDDLPNSSFVLTTSKPSVQTEGVTISLNKRSLLVATPSWHTWAERTSGYPHWGYARMRIKVTALSPACGGRVLPRGILGETFGTLRHLNPCTCPRPLSRVTGTLRPLLMTPVPTQTAMTWPSMARQMRTTYSTTAAPPAAAGTAGW